MRPSKEKPRAALAGEQARGSKEANQAPNPCGSVGTSILAFPAKRANRRLLTWRDELRLWRAERAPRGDYLTPLPGDLRTSVRP